MLPSRAKNDAASGRRAMTLIELLVVLVILAVLTTAATQSLGPVASRARYDATEKTLHQIKQAILNEQESGSSTVVSGFAADLGVLPNLSNGPSFLSSLVAGAGWPLFPVGGDTSIVCGWRGPYMHVANGSLQFADGWGNLLQFAAVDANENPIGALTSMTDRLLIVSCGDPLQPGNPISVTIPMSSVSASRLTVQLYGLDSDGNRLPLVGLGTTPKVTLRGGVNADGSLRAIEATATPSGTGYLCQFDATPSTLLIGARLISVSDLPTSPTETESGGMTTATTWYPQDVHLNLLPDSSPTVDLLIARQTTAPTEPEPTP